MKAFLEQLTDRVAAVDLGGIADDHGGIRHGEKVVGVLSTDLQRMYAVRVDLLTDFIRATGEAREHALIHLRQKESGHDTTVCDQVRQRLALAEFWRDTVNNIFWTSVRVAFPDVADKASIGVREGWQVVYDEDSDAEHASLRGLLEAFLQSVESTDS